MLRAHLRAQTAEAAHHFVADQQDVVLLQHLLDRRPVTHRWRQNTAGAHHRLADKGRDRIGAFLRDQLFQLVYAIRDELRFVHASGRLAVPVRANRVLDAFERQIEVLMKTRQARETSGDDARAVIAALARDDLLLVRPALNVVVVPDELDLRFVRIRSGHAVVHLLHPGWRPVDDARRQFDDGVGRMPHVRVVVGEFLRLLVDCIGHLGAAIADVHAIEAGKRVDIRLALVILDADALGARHDAARQRAAGVVVGVSGRVHEMRAVGLE